MTLRRQRMWLRKCSIRMNASECALARRAAFILQRLLWRQMPSRRQWCSLSRSRQTAWFLLWSFPSLPSAALSPGMAGSRRSGLRTWRNAHRIWNRFTMTADSSTASGWKASAGRKQSGWSMSYRLYRTRWMCRTLIRRRTGRLRRWNISCCGEKM